MNMLAIYARVHRRLMFRLPLMTRFGFIRMCLGDTLTHVFEKSTIIKTLGVLPKKIYSARCLYDDMCANVLRSLRFMKSAHTRTARQRKKQMAYNSNSIR